MLEVEAVPQSCIPQSRLVLALFYIWEIRDRLCGLVVRVPGYRSTGLGSIPGAARFSEK
jgi:hypothetical protein